MTHEVNFQYDVALSFAGEQRQYVDDVARELSSRGVRPFYDDYEKGALWGKDLYEHLTEVYQHLCKYCVIFVSKEYAGKVWPSRERQSAQARALEEKGEYILPARFDDTPIPGLLDTVSYINLRETSPSQLSELIAGKLGKDTRRYYLPPTLDRLYERLAIEDDYEAQIEVSSIAWSFFQVLHRMNEEERDAVFGLFRFGCHEDLPNDIHIDVDYLARCTGRSVASLERLLGAISSLGFECSILKKAQHGSTMPGTPLGGYPHYFHLRWLDLRDRKGKTGEGIPEMVVANHMVSVATGDYCEEHGKEFLDRLDFSQLSVATASREGHSN